MTPDNSNLLGKLKGSGSVFWKQKEPIIQGDFFAQSPSIEKGLSYQEFELSGDDIKLPEIRRQSSVFFTASLHYRIQCAWSDEGLMLKTSVEIGKYRERFFAKELITLLQIRFELSRVKLVRKWLEWKTNLPQVSRRLELLKVKLQ